MVEGHLTGWVGVIEERITPPLSILILQFGAGAHLHMSTLALVKVVQTTFEVVKVKVSATTL